MRSDRSSGTAQAVLDNAADGARLVFACSWHISMDGRDLYSWRQRLAKLFRGARLDNQAEACRRVFASDTRWTVVRRGDLREGESQGLPVWSGHVGDPVLRSNVTRRTDFALFMVEALSDDRLIHRAPAIVSRDAPSARRYAARHREGR